MSKRPRDLGEQVTESKRARTIEAKFDYEMRDKVISGLRLYSAYEPGKTFQFLNENNKLIPKLSLTPYAGDIGWGFIQSGMLYYLVDTSRILFKNDDNVVVGFINFINIGVETTTLDKQSLYAVMHLIAVHPMYRPYGNIGCILLSLGEDKLIQMSSNYGATELHIDINDVVFLDSSDEVYQFYYRNGYTPLAIHRGTIVMEKSIPVLLEQQGDESNLSSIDRQCSTKLLKAEVENYNASVNELEKILGQATLARVIGKRRIEGGVKLSNTIPYRKFRRSPINIQKRIDRLQRLEKTESKDEPLAKLIKQLQIEKEQYDENRAHFNEEYEQIREETQKQNAERELLNNRYLTEYLAARRGWDVLKKSVRRQI